MRATPSGRWMLVCLGVLATLGLAACAAHPAGSVTATNSQAASANPSTQPAPSSTVAAGSTPAPSADASPAASATAGSGIQNLVVTSAVRSGLIGAYAFVRGMSAGNVAGTTTGSVYYAYDPATGTYWAMAHFKAAAGDSPEIASGFQGAGGFGFFKKVSGGSWQGIQGGYPTLCNESQWFPLSVLAAWSLATSVPPGQSICPQ